jgi:hypothetical protein
VRSRLVGPLPGRHLVAGEQLLATPLRGVGHRPLPPPAQPYRGERRSWSRRSPAGYPSAALVVVVVEVEVVVGGLVVVVVVDVVVLVVVDVVVVVVGAVRG